MILVPSAKLIKKTKSRGVMLMRLILFGFAWASLFILLRRLINYLVLQGLDWVKELASKSLLHNLDSWHQTPNVFGLPLLRVLLHLL